MKKLVVLASGNGSNLQAVIEAVNSGELGYSIEAVISDKKEAYALQRAEKAGIKAVYFPFKKGSERRKYDTMLAKIVAGFSPDCVFLLGWMRILTDEFIIRFQNKIINLHPALPGAFSGVNAIERQFNAFKTGRIRECGIMTHYVTDEGVDTGPLIFKRTVPLFADDSLEEFEKRVHTEEHVLVIETLKWKLNN